ncbi:hypothetical protein D3C73_1210920 [compost metagenome]
MSMPKLEAPLARLSCSRLCLGTEPSAVRSTLRMLSLTIVLSTTLSPNRSSTTPSFNRKRPLPNTNAKVRISPSTCIVRRSTPLALAVSSVNGIAVSFPKKSENHDGWLAWEFSA